MSIEKTKNKIGIGITTHNRYDVFKKTYKEIVKYAPSGAKIVVIDDFSDKVVPEATYRFTKNVGIARAKNKCFELLEDCDHIFLFDDDCYPMSSDWYKPYIENKENHLMYIFLNFKNAKLNDTEVLYKDDKIISYSHARGCMLYYKKKILDKVGGMDIGYRKWGFEHEDLSNRIYNAGLTTHRIMDVIGSDKLIFSADEYQRVPSTVNGSERRSYLESMREKFNYSRTSKEFKPYKNYPPKNTNSIILTTFLNAMPDIQRNGIMWKQDYSAISKLRESTENNNIKLVVLHNCFDVEDSTLTKHVKVNQTLNPYLQRWLSYYEYLRDNPKIEYVFCVDATDVEVLNDPFEYLEKDIIYTGDENNYVGCAWMRGICKSKGLQDFILKFRNKRLLNAGVVGGSRELIMEFCKEMYYLYNLKFKDETIDMPLYNYVIYNEYNNKFINGRKVTTIFKGYEKESRAWFKHK